MKNNYLPFDKEPLSYDALSRIASSACKKAGIEERTKPEMNITSTKRKIGKKIIIIAAAALLAMPVAAGAYAIRSGSLEMFEKYHTGDTASFQHDLESTIKTVSDDNIVLAIDGIVADDFNCDINVSVYALNEEGRKVISMLEDPGQTKEMYAFSQILLEHEGADKGEEASEGKRTFDHSEMGYPDLDNETEYHVMLGVDMKNVDREKPFRLTEQWTGLSMEFDIAPYLESYRVYADEGTQGAYHFVTLSQFGAHICATTEDISPMSMYYSLNKNGDLPEIYVNYADGSSVKLDAVGGNSGYSTDGETWEYLGETFTAMEHLAIKMDDEGRTVFINAKDAVSVTINGIEYKKKQ